VDNLAIDVFVHRWFYMCQFDRYLYMAFVINPDILYGDDLRWAK